MPLAQHTVVALNRAAALVNTGVGEEQLPDAAALAPFVRSLGLTGHDTGEFSELSALRDLRAKLRTMWTADEDALIRLANGLLLEPGPALQLNRDTELRYSLRPVDAGSRLAPFLAFEAAMAIADVLWAGELSRLRTCQYPGCNRVGVDQSRNRSRRFCTGNCGNRASVAAYRLRKAPARVG